MEITRLSGILAQAGDGALILVHGPDIDRPEAATVVCSRRLAVLLALPSGEKADWSEAMAALDPADATAMADPVAELLRNGDTFARVVVAPGCGRADEPAAARLTSVLWFSDITREVETSEVARREIKTLRRDRSRYRAALDALPLPIWLRGDDLDISFCNVAFARAVEAQVLGGTVGIALDTTEQ